MITWIVEKKQVDKQFSLKGLFEFSKKWKAKIIIKDCCTLESGVVTWLN